jgi:DNA ligase (NAD+)
MTQDILSLTQHYLNQQADATTQSDYDILVDVINHHTQLYHVQQSPIISDYEYDQLFALLKKIESEHQ